MTARYLASLALALGLTLAGCSGDSGTKTDTDTDNTGDDDDDDTTIESGGTGIGDDDDDDDDGGYFEVYYLTWGGQFVYDQGTGTVTSLGTPYGDIPPTFDLTLAEQEWAQAGLDPNRTDLYCVISFDLTGGTDNPSWATAEPFVWYGVEYNGGKIYTDCTAEEGKELDPYYWGTPNDLAAYGPWGFAIGDLSPDAQQFLDDYYPQYAADPTFMGGVVMPGPFLGGYVDYNTLSFGYQVDGNGDIVYDNSGAIVPIDKNTATAGGNLATAWYSGSTIFLYY